MPVVRLTVVDNVHRPAFIDIPLCCRSQHGPLFIVSINDWPDDLSAESKGRLKADQNA